MKVILAMQKPRKCDGVLIPVAHFPFIIGRERGCSLRANIPTVGPRQCALLEKDHRLFIKEIGAAQDTLVNNREVRDQLELHDQDRVKVGSLEFTVRCDTQTAGPEQPAPGDIVEEVAGGLLLAMDHDEQASPSPPAAPADRAQKRAIPQQSNPRRPETPDTAAAAAKLLAKLNKQDGSGVVARRR